MIPAAAESSTWAFKAAAAAAASPQKEKQPRPPALDKAALAQQLPPSTSARTAWGDSPLGAGAVRIPAWRGEAAAAEEGDENRAPSAGAPSVSKAGLRSRSAAEPALPPPPPTTFAPDSRECWTFSCSGWLFVYTFGVVKALKELGLHKDIYAIGTSGGACAASYLFFGDDPADVDRTVAYIGECAVYARSHWRHPFRILACLEGAMDRFQPGGGAGAAAAAPAAPPPPPSTLSSTPHEEAGGPRRAGLGPAAAAALRGNLEVSVTTLPFLRNARVTAWGGAGELKAAMLASACAIPTSPVWLPQIGSWCIDGAVSDLNVLKGLLLGRRFMSLHQVPGAVSVSPFHASRADICPSAFVPPWWGAYPPGPAQLRWLFDLGRRDALAWLDRQGKLPGRAVEAASGDDADHPPGPDAPGWRSVLWEVRHLESRLAARLAGRRHGRGGGSTTSTSTSTTGAPHVPNLPALARRLVWAWIALELGASLCACALAVLVGPLLRDGVSAGDAARRWTAAARGCVGLALGGAGRAGAPAAAVDATLREHSAVWRWLRFCL